MFTHIFGSLLLLFGLFIVVMGYVRQIQNSRNRETGPYISPVPFVGPVFFVVGYAGSPLPFSPWIFLVFLLDPDTLLTVVAYVILGWRRVRR